QNIVKTFVPTAETPSPAQPLSPVKGKPACHTLSSPPPQRWIELSSSVERIPLLTTVLEIALRYFRHSDGVHTLRAEMEILDATLLPLILHLYSGPVRASTTGGGSEKRGIDEMSQHFLGIWIAVNRRSTNRRPLIEVNLCSQKFQNF